MKNEGFKQNWGFSYLNYKMGLFKREDAKVFNSVMNNV